MITYNSLPNENESICLAWFSIQKKMTIQQDNAQKNSQLLAHAWLNLGWRNPMIPPPRAAQGNIIKQPILLSITQSNPLMP